MAVVSLLLTWVFFYEYIPPFKRVHVWSDIEGYHYPLLSYTHKSVWEGRIPLWDPAIYCGIPFAGNIQAGLFYLPNWLLYAANARMPVHLRNPLGIPVEGPSPRGMRYTSVEILAFLHAWLAFFFTYLWLRERARHWLPAVFGGMVVGFSGYALSQMNHLGVFCGYAWIPFALWGIEQADVRADWRRLWKVSIASAMCLFAGYPPTWLALMIVAALYAALLPSRTRLLPATAAALAVSLLLGAVQLFPVYEATKMKTPEMAFGGELPFGKGIYASMILPNFFDQNRTGDGPEVSDGDYLYLGAPVWLGVVWLVRRGRFPGGWLGPGLAAGILFIAADPTGLVLRTIEHLPVVPDALRRYNLIAGIPMAGALLAASAVDDILARRQDRSLSHSFYIGWSVAAAAWAAYLIYTWPPGGSEFAKGWLSGAYSAISVAVLAIGLWILRSKPRSFAAAAILLVAFSEFKAFGTDRRFNAVADNADNFWRGDARLGGPSLNGLDTRVYQEMLRQPGYRVAIVEGPHSTDMRHYGLATLQGFDPFLSDQYKAAVETFVPFTTNRLFEIDPANERLLRHFGVRWILVRAENPVKQTLMKDASFRLLPPASSFYVVFEYLKAQPAWAFGGSVEMTAWDPERRSFRVRSERGGVFVLKEQFFPGWHAKVDGSTVPLTRADATFQAATVPAGVHELEFTYRPASIFVGAAVSALGLLVVVLVAWPRRTRSIDTLKVDVRVC